MGHIRVLYGGAVRAGRSRFPQRSTNQLNVREVEMSSRSARGYKVKTELSSGWKWGQFLFSSARLSFLRSDVSLLHPRIFRRVFSFRNLQTRNFRSNRGKRREKEEREEEEKRFNDHDFHSQSPKRFVPLCVCVSGALPLLSASAPSWALLWTFSMC